MISVYIFIFIYTRSSLHNIDRYIFTYLNIDTHFNFKDCVCRTDDVLYFLQYSVVMVVIALSCLAMVSSCLRKVSLSHRVFLCLADLWHVLYTFSSIRWALSCKALPGLMGCPANSYLVRCPASSVKM